MIVNFTTPRKYAQGLSFCNALSMCSTTARLPTPTRSLIVSSNVVFCLFCEIRPVRWLHFVCFCVTSPFGEGVLPLSFLSFSCQLTSHLRLSATISPRKEPITHKGKEHSIMLYYFKVRVEPREWSPDELWNQWEKEAEVALAAKAAGKIVALYKVVGQRRVVGIIDAESHDEMDQIIMAGLPIAHNLDSLLKNSIVEFIAQRGAVPSASIILAPSFPNTLLRKPQKRSRNVRTWASAEDGVPTKASTARENVPDST